MVAAVETMAYAKDRGVPWHGLGNPVESAMSATEALTLGGLDWKVFKNPLYTKLGEELIVVPDAYVTVRDSDNKILGTVAEEYVVFQNEEAMALIDQLFKDVGVEVRYETAISLQGGRVVAITARVPEDIQIGNGDKQFPYLLLRTGHDGNTATDIVPTFVRPVCWNTVTMAVSNRGRKGAEDASYGVTLWHMGTMEQKLKDAKVALNIALRNITEYKDLMDKLADTKATKKMEENVRDIVIPKPLELPEGRRDIVALLPEPDMRKYFQVVTPDLFANAQKLYEQKVEAWVSVRKEEDKSAYGLFNTVTGYADHARPRMWNVPEARMNQALFGVGAEMKNKGLREIRTLAHV